MVMGGPFCGPPAVAARAARPSGAPVSGGHGDTTPRSHHHDHTHFIGQTPAASSAARASASAADQATTPVDSVDAAGRRRGTTGWDAVHIAIDDATRIAYAEVLPDEKATTAIAFLRRAIKHFESYGMHVEELITDNGSPDISTIHAVACRALRIRHLRTDPTAPRPTAKPNASSAPCSVAGPTAAMYALAQNAPQPLTDGSGPTTIAANTQPSADRHPPTASTTSSELTASRAAPSA